MALFKPLSGLKFSHGLWNEGESRWFFYKVWVTRETQRADKTD
jgi:hypothetical protein